MFSYSRVLSCMISLVWFRSRFSNASVKYCVQWTFMSWNMSVALCLPDRCHNYRFSHPIVRDSLGPRDLRVRFPRASHRSSVHRLTFSLLYGYRSADRTAPLSMDPKIVRNSSHVDRHQRFPISLVSSIARGSEGLILLAQQSYTAYAVLCARRKHFSRYARSSIRLVDLFIVQTPPPSRLCNLFVDPKLMSFVHA